MKINESLNIVLPIRSEDSTPTLYAYHTPISREVFEANYRILAATKAALSGKGLQFLAGTGPQIAALALRDEARKDARDSGDVDSQGNPSEHACDALLADLKRLTMVVAPTPQGWDKVPVDVAIQKGYMTREEWPDVESALTFFTCLYALSPRAKLQETASATASILGAFTTSSSITDWVASLPTSTNEEPIAPKAGLSVPS